jgi:hypothetical protein
MVVTTGQDRIFVRLTREQLEEKKKRILMYICRSQLPVTPTHVSENFDICYPTAVALMMELAVEGVVKVTNRSGVRYFQAIPDKELQIKTLKEAKVEET